MKNAMMLFVVAAMQIGSTAGTPPPLLSIEAACKRPDSIHGERTQHPAWQKGCDFFGGDDGDVNICKQLCKQTYGDSVVIVDFREQTEDEGLLSYARKNGEYTYAQFNDANYCDKGAFMLFSFAPHVPFFKLVVH